MITMMINQFHQFYHDLTTLPVLMRGLQAAILISVVCSTLSVFVVLKRLAFIGEGIAHSALGGIALGILIFVSGPMVEQTFGSRLGIDLTTLVFCVGVAWLIGWTSRRKIISEDTAIGIFFVASLAFGVMLISLRKEYTAELFSFLFGSILAVGPFDVYTTIILAVFVLTTVVLFFRPMFLFCLDEELAGVSGIPTGFLHYTLLTLLAVTVVVSIKILGVLLIAAFLVIPGAIARMLTCRYRNMFIIANVSGLLAVLGGLILSDVISDLPSGPSIVLGEFFIFIFAVAWARLRDRFAPGRELAFVGTSIVMLCYVIILLAICSAASASVAAQARPAKPAAASSIDDAGWHFFVSALKSGKYGDLDHRIDSDARFVELITRRINQLPLSGNEKDQFLDAMASMNWRSLPPNLVDKLK